MSTNKNMTAAVEALLFVYGEPMAIKRIAKVLGVKADEVEGALAELRQSLLAENRGLALLLDKETVQLVTKPAFGNLLETIVKEELQESLTPAALETLSIVAYAGPISRSELEYIRGVNSSFTLRNLLIRGLVDRSLDPKRANAYIYTPSANFLKHIGLTNIASLPEYEHFKSLVEKLRQPHEAEQPENDSAQPA